MYLECLAVGQAREALDECLFINCDKIIDNIKFTSQTAFNFLCLFTHSMVEGERRTEVVGVTHNILGIVANDLVLNISTNELFSIRFDILNVCILCRGNN